VTFDELDRGGDHGSTGTVDQHTIGCPIGGAIEESTRNLGICRIGVVFESMSGTFVVDQTVLEVSKSGNGRK